MNLTVRDRLALTLVLPEKGRMIEMIIVDSIISMTKLSIEEISKYQVYDSLSGQTVFNESLTVDLEVDFTAEQVELLKKRFDALDEQGAITKDMVRLYQKVQSLK